MNENNSLKCAPHGLSRSAVFLVAFLAAAQTAPVCGADSAELPVAISPDNKSIRYVGRFETKDPKQYRFAWAGSAIVFKFEGKSANLLMEDEWGGGPNPEGGNNNNYFSVFIDDKQPLELSLENKRKVYRIGEGLEDGVHTVTVFRRNCPRVGPVKFFGLQLEAGKSLREPPPAKKRCIEVIGDSISVGYGIMGKSKDSPAIPIFENCYLTYGALAAREFDAEFVCIAWSGCGVFRDLQGSKENVLTNLYGLTVPHDKTGAWSFKGYTPDVVVINLGTNDFHPRHNGDPPKAEFNAAYRALIEQVWKHAPKAHVFCASSAMLEAKLVATFKEYLAELIGDLQKEGKKNVHYVQFPLQHEMAGGFGGAYHPSAVCHRAMADVLIKEVKKELGW